MVAAEEGEVPRRWILPKYLMGNLPAFNELLDKRSVTLQSLIWYLRAFSMPLYVNNPISGVLVVIAVYVNHYVRATNGTMALAAGFYVFLLGLKDVSPLRDGDLVLNCYLLGLLLPMYVSGPPFTYDWKVIVIVMLLAVICAYLAIGVHSLTSRAQLPALNLATSLVLLAFVAVTRSSQHFPAPAPTPAPLVATYANISGRLIGEGIMRGVGMTLGVSSHAGCAILFAALLFYSPLQSVQALLGSCLAVCTALALGAPLEQVYSGEYGYNAVWSCMAVGGLYIVFGAHGQLVTVIAGIASTLIHIGMERTMSQYGLVPLTFPHVITVYLILSASHIMKGLPKPSEITYPEQHYFEWWLSERKIEPTEPGSQEMMTRETSEVGSVA